jgi:hypothetical protein
MSIYKQIFATASIFAIAATALVSPMASAASVQISGNALPSNVRLCAQDVGTSGTQRTDVTNGATLTGSVNGIEYKLFTTSLNNCTGSNTTDYTTVTNNFSVLTNHVTTLSFTGTGPYTVTPTYDNNAPRYNGDTTFSVCQGDSRFINILVTDADADVLNGTFTGNGNNAFVTVTYPQNGQVNYQIEPKSAFYNTQNTTAADIVLSTTQSNLNTTALTTAVFGSNAAVTTTISLRTVSCPNGIPSNSSAKSSSSMSSSSMMSSSSAAPVASAAAVSSTPATVVVDAPSVGKGVNTVRTGGAY